MMDRYIAIFHPTEVQFHVITHKWASSVLFMCVSEKEIKIGVGKSE